MARPPSTGFYSADISIGSSIVADRTSHFIKKQAISEFGEVCITGDEIFAQRCFGGFAEEGGKTVDEADVARDGPGTPPASTASPRSARSARLEG